MADPKEIRAALNKLDTMEDDHWTTDGQPKLEALDVKATRQEVIDAASQFSRSNPILDEETPESNPPEPESASEELSSSAMASLKELEEREEPMTPHEFVRWLQNVSKYDLEALQGYLHAQKQQADEAQSRAEEYGLRLKQNMALVVNRMKRELPEQSNQDAIRAYMESQQQLRAEKLARTNTILQNIDVKDLDPRAAIDRAMARKNPRGGTRPRR